MEPLPLRALGSQGLRVQAQGFGAMGLTRSFLSYHDVADTAKDADSLATVAHALKLAGPHPLFLDTSDVYGPFTNEEFIGRLVQLHGQQRFSIATKCGMVRREDGKTVVDGSRQHIRAACEASLRRLNTDVIDLFYLHRVDRSMRLEESFEEFAALMKEGKIKHVGVCECTAEELRRAHAVVPISAVQLEWSLWTREHEADVIPAARELGVGVVAFSPLGRGFLAGNVKDTSALRPDDMRLRSVPRFQGDNFKQNLRLLEGLQAEATALGVPPSQLALAWLHAQGEDVFPIPGTKRVAYLEQNVGAFALSRTLSPELLGRLEALFAPQAVAGGRYDAAGARMAKDGGLQGANL